MAETKKEVDRLDLDKMYQLHLKQFKIKLQDPDNVLSTTKCAFVSGVTQTIVIMNELAMAYEPKKINALMQDLLVQAEVHYSRVEQALKKCVNGRLEKKA